MFRHILVPLDGSLRAERAIPVAARLARASEGTLIFLRVVQTDQEHGHTTGTGSPLFQTTLQDRQKEAQHYLTAIASSHTLAGLPIIISAPQGSIIANIEQTIQTYQVDLLVGCDQPEAGDFRQLLDPFVERLSQHITIPLLLLPAQEPLHDPLLVPGSPMTCLIAFAGSQPEPALIPPAAALLAALAEQETGHLHCAPFRSLLSRSAMIHQDLQSAALARKQERYARRSIVLLEEEPAGAGYAEKQKTRPREVIILAMPLPVIDNDILQEIATCPRLLVPVPASKAD